LHPLEQLALDVACGRTGPREGERAAARLASEGALTGQDLVGWFKTAQWLAHREDRWERALLLGTLLAAAVEALPRSTPSYDLVRCRSSWTELVHLCLVHRPDGALFASGVRGGRAALVGARELNDDDLAGQTLYRLGTLYLDPFSRARDLWWEEHRLWLSLGTEEALHGLPEPYEALETAEAYLREAAALRTGAGLGYTYKALAQTLQQQEFLARAGTGGRGGTDTADHARAVIALCDQALGLIPADDLVARANVEAIRSGSGSAEPSESA
jgi:hypothetical protein